MSYSSQKMSALRLCELMKIKADEKFRRMNILASNKSFHLEKKVGQLQKRSFAQCET